MMRRLRDIFVSSLALIALSPMLIVVASLVRIDSTGPVLFRQTRVGVGGTEFSVLKFRTMRLVGTGPSVTSADDPRVTRVGRFLRYSKMDELPQLINVLKGEMSLVGPRPEVPVFAALWPAELRPIILSVRPGITDPASVILRHESLYLAGSSDPDTTYAELLLPKKAQIYAAYVQHRTHLGDLGIIVRTIAAVLTPTGHESMSVKDLVL